MSGSKVRPVLFSSVLQLPASSFDPGFDHTVSLYPKHKLLSWFFVVAKIITNLIFGHLWTLPAKFVTRGAPMILHIKTLFLFYINSV